MIIYILCNNYYYCYINNNSPLGRKLIEPGKKTLQLSYAGYNDQSSRTTENVEFSTVPCLLCQGKEYDWKRQYLWDLRWELGNQFTESPKPFEYTEVAHFSPLEASTSPYLNMMRKAVTCFSLRIYIHNLPGKSATWNM